MAKKRKIILEKEVEPVIYSDIKIDAENEDVEKLITLLKNLIDEEDIARIVKEKAREALIILSKNDDPLDIRLQRIISLFEELNEEPNLDQFSRISIWNLVSFIETIA
jgi:uncharacterized protein (UPF0147 family)